MSTTPQEKAPVPATAGPLGGTLTIGGDVTIHRLGFGAMRLCGPGVWGESLDPSAAKRVLTGAVELGITLIDTADAYGPEANERFIAETLYPYPDELVVATKGGHPRRARVERTASVFARWVMPSVRLASLPSSPVCVRPASS